MKTITLLAIAFLFSVCSPTVATNQDSTPPNHKAYDALLNKYVDEKGMVDYSGFKKERQKLKDYLRNLEQNAPNDKWTENEKLAYWINAYNAFTLDLILEHHPVESIKDIGSKIQIPFVNSPWDIQ